MPHTRILIALVLINMIGMIGSFNEAFDAIFFLHEICCNILLETNCRETFSLGIVSAGQEYIQHYSTHVYFRVEMNNGRASPLSHCLFRAQIRL